MAKSKTVEQIERLVGELQARRNELQAELTQIDNALANINVGGAAPAAPKRRGRKPGPKPGRKLGRPVGSKNKKTTKKTTRRRGGRGRFAKTGEDSIVEFIKGAGGEPSTAEINKHWQSEGRGGKADNTLTKLVKKGVLKRVQTPGVRGSRYRVA